ncbi:MAG: hypothetical protein ACTHZI_01525 [Luteimonas sp.]
MPRVETNLDRATKEAFRNLAKQSGTTEAALLRRVISTVVKLNPISRTDLTSATVRSMRLTVRVTPEIFEAVTRTARNAGTTRPGVVLGTLRARFLQAPTLLPAEAEAIGLAAYQLSMVGTNLNQLARSLHQGRIEALKDRDPVLVETASAVAALREQVHALVEAATVRWAPAEGWE